MGIKERWEGFAPLPEDIKSRLSILIPLFAKERILLAYLFGSLGKGEGGEDADLALLPKGKGLVGLREKIWELLGTHKGSMW